MAKFHGFEPRRPSWRLFLGGSGWILACKAYIHYGLWILCPDESLKHLFMASGSLKKSQKQASKWQIFYRFGPPTPSKKAFLA